MKRSLIQFETEEQPYIFFIGHLSYKKDSDYSVVNYCVDNMLEL